MFGQANQICSRCGGFIKVEEGGQAEVVMRNMQSGISFKVINPDFLLAEKD